MVLRTTPREVGSSQNLTKYSKQNNILEKEFYVTLFPTRKSKRPSLQTCKSIDTICEHINKMLSLIFCPQGQKVRPKKVQQKKRRESVFICVVSRTALLLRTEMCKSRGLKLRPLFQVLFVFLPAACGMVKFYLSLFSPFFLQEGIISFSYQPAKFLETTPTTPTNLQILLANFTCKFYLFLEILDFLKNFFLEFLKILKF